MGRKIVQYQLISIPVILVAYTQLVLKWQVSKVLAGNLYQHSNLRFFVALLLNPWTVSALLAAFGSAAVWLVVLSRFPLSYAYPFLSLSFLLVGLGGMLFLSEQISPLRIGGLLFIVVGVALNAAG